MAAAMVDHRAARSSPFLLAQRRFIEGITLTGIKVTRRTQPRGRSSNAENMDHGRGPCLLAGRRGAGADPDRNRRCSIPIRNCSPETHKQIAEEFAKVRPDIKVTMRAPYRVL